MRQKGQVNFVGTAVIFIVPFFPAILYANSPVVEL